MLLLSLNALPKQPPMSLPPPDCRCRFVLCVFDLFYGTLDIIVCLEQKSVTWARKKDCCNMVAFVLQYIG